MKTVRVNNGVVVEIIPDYALPAETWYGAAFAAQCVEAPDEVEQHWTYDGEAFSPPAEKAEGTPEPETVEARLNALEKAIAKGLSL